MFLKELMRNFPHVRELHFVYGAYKLVKTFGKKIVHRYFNESFGGPYADQIRACDEAFFMSPAFQLPPDYRFYSEYVHPLQRLWSTLDDTNKRAIWQHLHALVFLSQEIDKTKHTSKDVADEENYQTCCKELHVGTPTPIL